MEYPREPCPWRVLDDFGGAFSMGSIGGSLFQGVIGLRNAPSGFRRRLLGGVTALKNHTPQIAGNFGVWGGLFSAIECTLSHYRRKDDPWNSIMSGALTGGLLSARIGLTAMLGSATVGGVFLALIEGISITITRLQADDFAQHMSIYDMGKSKQPETLSSGKAYAFAGTPISASVLADTEGNSKG